MKKRNNIFAAAFDEMKRRKIVKTQKELAQKMGVNENTITRILKDYVEVTEDIITKLQTASGCIFNLQWLRGEDSTHMLAEDVAESSQSVPVSEPGQLDLSSVMNAALSAQMETISSLKAQLSSKEDTIDSLRALLAEKDARLCEKDELISVLRSRIADLERTLASSTLSDISHYPFTIGAAENTQTSPNHSSK